MPRIAASVLIVVTAAVIWPSTALAQIDKRFDTSRPMTVKGTLGGLAVPEPGRSFLIVSTTDAAGKDQAWVLLGDDLNTLMSAGWKIRALPLGQTVSASGFALRPTAKALEFLPPEASTVIVEALKAGRLLHGIDVTFADGKKLPLGPAR